VRICQPSGAWDSSAPTCSATNCGSLSPPTNGSVSDPSTTVGGTATYSCDAGFSLTGSSTRTCQSSGSWTGSAPACN
jgi:CUB/sushi domain-containing protein